MNTYYYKEFLQTIFLSWAFLVLLSICTELENSYRSVSATHLEASHEYEDCHTSTYYFKYPIKCARVLAKPPSSFLSSWLSVAFTDVRWCGTSKCETFFTWRNILAGVVVRFLTEPCVREGVVYTYDTIKTGMKERQVAKLIDS